MSKRKKIEWNKSQRIDSDVYIRVFMRSLESRFSPAQRHEIYYISKLFVDGTVEVGRNRFRVADWFFQQGEAYLHKFGTNAIERKLLFGIYARSKALYFYRVKEYEQAIRLTEEAFAVNKELEANGFPFLAFDRFSQYHNLSKIYFAISQPRMGLSILSSVIAFLMTGSANEQIDPIENFIENLDEEGAQMRSSLICLLLFETVGRLQQEGIHEVFLEESAFFFSKIWASLSDFKLLSQTDGYLKEWLEIVNNYYENSRGDFKKEATVYLATTHRFYGNVPLNILQRYLARIPALEQSIDG